MIRLVQLQNGSIRKLALVAEPHLQLLNQFASVYELAQAALAQGQSISALAQASVSDEQLAYDAVYQGQSEWRILPAADHPEEPARCMVAGTGLTHLASAKNRSAMHEQKPEQLTDSMKMFQWGIDGGKPAAGEIGIAPEWFYKGCGTQLRGHNDPLETPTFAEDGGEEPEVAGVYLIGANGQPYRIGFAIGNEFSDHKFEKRNYLNLAGSKLRTSAIGPELIIGHDFQSVPGTVTVERDGQVLWSATIKTGEAEMSHSLANLEHHHFKFVGHRRPGDLHIHYYGADAFSFGAGVQLQDGDVMIVEWEGFGRPLRNVVQVAKETDQAVNVTALT